MEKVYTAWATNSPTGALTSLFMSEKVVGLAELAYLCKVSKHAAIRYSRRPDFPEPLARLASGPVWERRKVQAWADRTLPLPKGRPPTKRNKRKPR
jgi:hypothetical protein